MSTTTAEEKSFGDKTGTFADKTKTFNENFKSALDTVSAKGAKATHPPTAEKPLTLSQLARELEREGAALDEQRATVAATEARIAAKQKAMRTMTDEIGKRK